MFTFIIFVLVLGILVLAHESGHFFVARSFGVKCDEFGIGFPPRMFGVYKNQENKWRFFWGRKQIKDAQSTIYSLNWIPLGGFVKIKGIEDFPGEEKSEDQGENNSFAEKAIWKRVSILSAGVIMNIVLAGIIISIGLMIGMPQITDDAGTQGQVQNSVVQVFDVFPNTPAKEAGLQMGDIILSVNGQSFDNLTALQDYTDKHVNEKLDYRIKRLDKELDQEITPKIMDATHRGGIGVSIAEIGIVSYPWYIAIIRGFKTTFVMLWTIFVAILMVLKGLFTGHGAGDISGPVGIATMTGQMARMGIIYLLQFTALLSLNLAILNFLPIPALDGGRVLFLIIEKIKGKPVKKETEAMIHNIGFILLMLLIVAVTFKDIGNLGCLSCKITSWWNSLVH